MRTNSRARTGLVRGSAALALALSLAACSSSASPSPGAGEETAAAPEPSATPAAAASLHVMVPAQPGTGWEVTGSALQAALTAEGVVNGVDIVNYNGADGTVGLTQLVGQADPASLLVLGDALVGAVELTRASATLADVTPVARLTQDPLALVVAADSPYETVADLVADIAANGQDVPLGGGPAGSADHVLAARLLLASGMPADEVTTKLRYVPQGVSGESFDALFDGSVRAAVADVGEHADLLAAGSLRALAVSGAERSPSLPDVPTLREQELDVVLSSWRGVAVAGAVDGARVAELVAAMTDVHGTAGWTSALAENGWTDAFLTGPELDAFVDAEVASVRQTLLDVGLTS